MKIGIDLGGSHIGIGIIDDKQNIIEDFVKHFCDEDKKDIVNIIEKYICEITQKAKEKYDIEYIGIAIPGCVQNGNVIRTINLGINNYDIIKRLNTKLDIPIFIQNDGKCACVAEYNNMVKNSEIAKDINMLFLTIGTGIGGGVIYNGKLLQGKSFGGYEFGHMVIKQNGILCNCGKRGCFEKYGSILSYKNKVKNRLGIDNNINGDELRKIMDSRKNEFVDIENTYVQDLALGISNLINIFEPEIVVLGGGFSKFAYMFIDKIKEELLNSNLLVNKRKDIDLRIAKLGNDAGMIGATQIKCFTI